MSTQRKTYISEALLSEKPKRKLGLLINDNAVTTPKIRDKAVTTEKIALEAITHKLLADNSVGTDNLYDSSVVSDKIMDNTIGGEKLKSGSIDKRHIAADAVTEEKIAAGAISTDEIQDGCVTLQKLAPDVVGALLKAVSQSTIMSSVVFMSSFATDYPEVSKAGVYAFNGSNLYQSYMDNGTIKWQIAQVEPNKIYVDESTAQSYVADKQGKLIRLDKESTDIIYDVVDN